MRNGNYILILHTHLPWVLHHGQWPHGEDWITETTAECYIPLLNMCNRLLADGINPNITIGISPVLCEQLEHRDFPAIFENYCESKIKKANKDIEKFKFYNAHPHMTYLAGRWAEWYSERLKDFREKYDESIIGAFAELQNRGVLEVITCAATHGYLPLLPTEKSINMQVRLAVENYKKYFGRSPRGIWLPECAYRPSYEWASLLPIFPYNIKKLRPGIEQFLANEGIEYFVSDEPNLMRSSLLGNFNYRTKSGFMPATDEERKFYDGSKTPLKIYNVASSTKTEYGTAVVFTRHHDISMQVWSGTIGYPGEPDYLDFHKKEAGSMLRYWSVTDSKLDMQYKKFYYPDNVAKDIDMQSNHFIHHLENSVNYFNSVSGGLKASLCTPFDTELFGHWWFEGPRFIEAVMRGLHYSPFIEASTASEYLLQNPPKEVIHLPESSWGENNNHDVWSNPENIWTWEFIYNDENRLIMFFDKFPLDKLNRVALRIMKQAYRELLLEQSSDWQFLIHTQSAKDYAEMRLSNHHSDFNGLVSLAEKIQQGGELSVEDGKYLTETENRDSLFEELDLHWWKDLEF